MLYQQFKLFCCAHTKYIINMLILKLKREINDNQNYVITGFLFDLNSLVQPKNHKLY